MYVVADILFSLVMDMLFMMQVGVSLNYHSCTDGCVTCYVQLQITTSPILLAVNVGWIHSDCWVPTECCASSLVDIFVCF